MNLKQSELLHGNEKLFWASEREIPVPFSVSIQYISSLVPLCRIRECDEEVSLRSVEITAARQSRADHYDHENSIT